MITEPVSKDLAKLSAAAEELIKAAASHVEANSFQTSIDSLKTSIDSKMNTLDQSISNLKEELALHSKNQKLEWAFSNAGYNSFKHYQKGGCGDVDSKFVVQRIMLSFRQGRGHYIYDYSMTQYHGNQIEEGEKQFRDALTNQIYYLIGHKPRVALENNKYAIYYS